MEQPMATPALTQPRESWPIVLQFKPLATFDDEQFLDFCQLNQDWQFERTAAGELIIMSPKGSETGGYNFDLIVELGIWARQDGTGQGFDSSTGFTLPNGAVRSPDAAWIKRDRWEAIPPEQRRKICADLSRLRTRTALRVRCPRASASQNAGISRERCSTRLVARSQKPPRLSLQARASGRMLRESRID